MDRSDFTYIGDKVDIGRCFFFKNLQFIDVFIFFYIMITMIFHKKIRNMFLDQYYNLIIKKKISSFFQHLYSI